jgi:hypothetical protein
MTLEELHRTVVDLHRTMVDGFSAIDERWARNDGRLLGIEAQLTDLRSDMDARFREEGETIRRHFDVVAERVEASVKIVAEGHGHLMTIVANHETRLQSLEKRA